VSDTSYAGVLSANKSNNFAALATLIEVVGLVGG